MDDRYQENLRRFMYIASALLFMSQLVMVLHIYFMNSQIEKLFLKSDEILGVLNTWEK